MAGGPMDLKDLEIYADTAHLTEIAAWSTDPRVRGFTTNPTLIRATGSGHLRVWAHGALALVRDRPMSLPMLAPDLEHMALQAPQIAEWGKNVYVKIPIMTSAGESTLPLIERLSQGGIQLNVTAVFTASQAIAVGKVVRGGAPTIVSVFAGRVADTGEDPLPLMMHTSMSLHRHPNARLLWGSARQLWDVAQAVHAHCAIITLPPALLRKLPLLDTDIDTYNRETVRQFEEDARELRW